jgi:hypothetical protein
VTKVSILTPPKLASTNVAFLACEDYESCQVKHFAVQPFDWKHFFVDDHRNEKLRLTWDPQKPCFFPVPSECFEGSKEATGWNFISIRVHWPSCFGHGNSLQYQNVDCTRLEAVHFFLNSLTSFWLHDEISVIQYSFLLQHPLCLCPDLKHLTNSPADDMFCGCPTMSEVCWLDEWQALCHLEGTRDPLPSKHNFYLLVETTGSNEAHDK